MRTLPVALVILSLLATVFAGCLTPETSGDARISRVHTLTFTRATTAAADEHSDDPMAALRELLKTDLVVRVADAGDYTLEYLDGKGNPQTQALVGATPATPVTVTGADPLAPVLLKQGETIVATRAGINAAWWHLGDMPLGINATEGAKTKYDFTSRLQETLTLDDLDITEQDVRVDTLRFDLTLPIDGSVAWELQPDTGEGAPLLLTGDIGVDEDAGDLLSVEIEASQAGAPGTAGIVAGVDTARATGSSKFWVKDGEPVASQFLGGSVKAVPRTTVWADGFFADLAEGQSCAGKTKADRCAPEEIESYEETFPANEKDTWDSSDMFHAESDEDREAVTLIQRLFAQDIVPGDKATILVRADGEDFGSSSDAPRGNAMAQFTIEALDTETIEIPAGRFDALKITEELITRVNIESIPGAPDGGSIVNGYGLDETIARTTFWLDRSTYQPLKMRAQTPFDAEEILRDAIDSIDPSAWDSIGGKPLEDRQWSLTAVAESSYEAVELRPDTHFSALVGFALAHALTGTMGASPAYALSGRLFGMATSAEDVYARPAMSLALTSNGPIEEGVKSYSVAAASEGMAWGDLTLSLDGESLYLEVQRAPATYDPVGCPDPTIPCATEPVEDTTAGCAAPSAGSFTVCSGGYAANYGDPVVAGDVLSLQAQPGQTLRIIDPYSNSVILTLTVG